MNYGLINSVNTATVELASLVGINNVIKLAKGLGIKSELSPNLSLALGSSEVSLLNLTCAYAGFLNKGRPVYPRGWLDLRLKSTEEVLMSSVKETSEQVIDKNTSQALIHILSEVVQTGTGKSAQISDWHIAGKTGTSQNARDAWFIGFTSNYIIGVWMGSDDNTPLKGVVGGNLPSVIWAEISKKIHLKKRIMTAIVTTPIIIPTTVNKVDDVSRDFFSSTNKLVKDVPISLCFSTPERTSSPSASMPLRSKCQDSGQ